MAIGDNDSVGFSRFLESTRSTSYRDLRALGGLHIAEETEFEKMRQHILNKYDGVDVIHSYLDDAGQIWDCIPIEQQPSLRGSSVGVATPPELPVSQKPAKKPSREGVSLKPHARPGETDRLGNEMSCPAGTIPMRRVTLLEMARFRTLADFFRKAPDGGQHPRLTGANAATAAHKYAHASSSVYNTGGYSVVNVWQPAINTGATQVFSLAQHWYSGGSGTGLQTVECGWQVYPGKYGNANSNLFIYWTADGYGSTGCYNLDCAAFVQVNSNFHLGGALKPSTPGGTQIEVEYCFSLIQGNWWLYLMGTQASDAVGYYPTALFKGGQLAYNATDIDYGGETVGTTSWPPMGGGAYAYQGAGLAAYQRNILYFPPGDVVSPQLVEDQPSPSCYTIDVSGKGSWGEHFFFGGPGGSSC